MCIKHAVVASDKKPSILIAGIRATLSFLHPILFREPVTIRDESTYFYFKVL